MSSSTVPEGGPSSANWQNGVKAALAGPWANVALVAGLAIALGLLLPKFLPGDNNVSDKERPKTDAKGLDAKGPAEYKAPALPDAPNPHVLLGRLFTGTIVVLGLSVVSIWGMRRWLQGQGPANTGQREMRLIETLSLGNRTSLHLVHLGKREILVGTDGGGIKSIVPLPAQGGFEDALAEAESTDVLPFVAPQNTNQA